MFQIPQRQYWSCMGETVLKKTQFDGDSATARANNRQYADTMASQQAQQQARITLSQPQSPFVLSSQAQPQQPQATPLQRFVQTLTDMLARPFVLIQTAFQSTAQQLGQLLPQPLLQVPGFLDKAMSQVLSFFFGYKKDTREEKEKRDRNDAALLGMFGENEFFGAGKVEQKENSGLGSGSGK